MNTIVLCTNRLKEYRTKYYSNNTLLKRNQWMPPIPKAAKMKENCGMGSLWML